MSIFPEALSAAFAIAAPVRSEKKTGEREGEGQDKRQIETKRCGECDRFIYRLKVRSWRTRRMTHIDQMDGKQSMRVVSEKRLPDQ